MVKIPPASVGDARNLGSIPGSGIFPGEGNGNRLQYSCLRNPMDRGTGRLQSMRLQTVGHSTNYTKAFQSLASSLLRTLGSASYSLGQQKKVCVTSRRCSETVFFFFFQCLIFLLSTKQFCVWAQLFRCFLKEEKLCTLGYV